MSRRALVSESPWNVVVVCQKCERILLRYRAWMDGDREGVTGGDSWEPADAQVTTFELGSKFHFSCRCGARPQVRYDTVAEAASPYGRRTLKI